MQTVGLPHRCVPESVLGPQAETRCTSHPRLAKVYRTWWKVGSDLHLVNRKSNTATCSTFNVKQASDLGILELRPDLESEPRERGHTWSRLNQTKMFEVPHFSPLIPPSLCPLSHLRPTFNVH